ncbi:glycosyltransferase family 4 protein [Paenarthrobacter sp. NPDC089322]|uniref:glycosyltransferase family 4 protein n=1 Tax=Paenarthrobacter sp. NPDC089322 TaxID=3155065 RepID=UPI003439B60A
MAANDLPLADRFLSMSRGTSGNAATMARRFWYDGAISEAIAVLAQDSDRSHKRGSVQLCRLQSEQAVLDGWMPALPSTPMVPEPKRVLHLLTNSLPHTQSGYARRSHEILLAQKAAGWETLAVTRLGYPVLVGKLGAGLVDVVDNVRYQRLLPPRMEPTTSGRLQQQAEELLKLALEFRPSIIHTTTHYANAIVARAVAQALGIPWVYEVRGQLADTWASTRGPEATASERYRLFQDRESDSMLSADLVFTLGEAMKANIAAAGVPAERILLAPNGVGGSYLEAPLSVAEARRQLGLDVDAQIVGTVSSLVDYEGLDDLIAAFEVLAPEHPRLQLLIVGDGASMPALQHQAVKTGLGNRIRFVGRVPASLARTYHSAFDAFVVPRKNLGVTRSVTPLKPVEAMACSRPVLASDLPALAEIVDHGVTGLLVRPEDPAELARSLAQLLADPPQMTAMGIAGRDLVLSTRTWDANAAAYVRAYQALTNERQRRFS